MAAPPPIIEQVFRHTCFIRIHNPRIAFLATVFIEFLLPPELLCPWHLVDKGHIISTAIHAFV